MSKKTKSAKVMGETAMLFAGGVILDVFAHSWTNSHDDSLILGLSPHVMSGVATICSHLTVHGVFEGLLKSKENLSSDVNSHLEHAIVNAYNRTFEEIRKEIIAEYNLKETKKDWIFRFFFNEDNDNNLALEELETDFLIPLKTSLSDSDEIEKMLLVNDQLHPDEYLKKMIERVAPSEYLNDKNILKIFTSSVLEKFKRLYKHFFLQELKSEDKAKTVYFTHLLETIIGKVESLYNGQQEKLKNAIELIQEFKYETGAKSETITIGLNELNDNIRSISSSVNQMSEKIDFLFNQAKSQIFVENSSIEQKETVIEKEIIIEREVIVEKEIIVEKEVIIEKEVFVNTYFKDLDAVLSKWIMASQSQDTLRYFFELYNNQISDNNSTLAEELELAYTSLYLRTKNKSVNSTFQKIAKVRASFYAKLLLNNDKASDKFCWEVVDRCLMNMPDDGLAEVLREIHSYTICTNKTKHFWALIIDWALGNDSLDDNTPFCSLNKYATNNLLLKNEIEFNKVLAEFNSDIIIENVTAAFKISACAWNLSEEPFNGIPFYDLILDELNKMLNSEILPKKLAASYAFYRLVDIPNLGNFNGNRIREVDKLSLIENLANPTCSPMLLQIISGLLGKAFSCEY